MSERLSREIAAGAAATDQFMAAARDHPDLESASAELAAAQARMVEIYQDIGMTPEIAISALVQGGAQWVFRIYGMRDA